ncbi:MAG: biopolymer transporter ExbD [Chitinophagaceae bacterium]|nr:biopolymer transporter ExbD [Chitinophagaceae bacterium]
MAEMEVKDSGGKKGPGVKKAKKASTRVDLTPMVDLGFLLITFFIFSTTMSQPTSMNLNMPKDTEKPTDDTKVKESGSLTILMGKANVVYYYLGNEIMDLQTTNYKDIRDVIMKKKRSTPIDDLYIIIKPNSDASYKNVVDILDEMNICDIPRYAMMDPTDDENALIHKTEEAAGIQ